MNPVARTTGPWLGSFWTGNSGGFDALGVVPKRRLQPFFLANR
jgi:hypothetical protein